ncbi:hypothetical protein AgCh_017322 [Apium graveolens]
MDLVRLILKKQVLTVLKAVEDKIDNEISALDRLDLEDIKVLREWRLQQMKKMSDKRRQGVALGYGEYLEIYVEKEFFSVVKASDRVVYQFYRENWPFKVMKERAKNRVDDLQGMFCDLQSTRKESCTNDVALSEEQVNQMLREWQFELNHPSPASSDTSKAVIEMKKINVTFELLNAETNERICFINVSPDEVI